MARSQGSGRLAGLSAVALLALPAALGFGGDPTSRPAQPATTQPAAGPTSRPSTPATTRPAAPADDPGIVLAKQIERAHGLDAWRAKQAVQFNLALSFSSRPSLECRVILDVHNARARIIFTTGTVLVFDGEHCWFDPPEKFNRSARFSLKTWPYFLAVPFKLRDPGAHLKPEDPAELAGKSYLTAKLTFDPGTGDTPDDWYVLYLNPQTHRLQAMGYIVTYGQSLADATVNPHAILYDDFHTIDGVTLSTLWTFHQWTRERGLGPEVGRGEITSVEFITPPEGTFERPPTSAEDLTDPKVTK